jgi:serine/threonine protein kinase
MQKLKQYSSLLITAATPLPQVVRKPGLVKLWLFTISPKRLFLLVGLLLLFFGVSPISRNVVDIWHPEREKTLKNTLSGMFNPKALKAEQELRETRYEQLVIIFLSLGLSVTAIVLILDLPSVLKKGEQQAQKLLQQSQSVQSTNPELADTLAQTAYKLMLKPAPPVDTLEARNTSSTNDTSDLARTVIRTVAITKPEKVIRYVGENKRYRIDKPLASGGAGIVYLAFDTVLERQVALKELFEELANDKEHAERFKVEAKALASLNHPNVLPIYDFLQESGHFWLVMELLGGGNLKDKINKTGVLKVTEAISITRGIAAGLGYAHEKGFIHRDIKPENILFATDGSYRITDFGIAKHGASVVKTQHGIIMGSPGYMSPEQAAGEEIDSRADIYSLGITLFQMVTGSLPFEGDTSSVLAQHITQAPPKPSELNPEISGKVESIILKMLQKKPHKRFPSTDALIKSLDGLKLT